VRLVALFIALSGVAYADDPPPPPTPRLDVAVGKTVEQNVGYTRGGWFCDDQTLITADLVTRGDTNYWIVTGVKAGSTQCRVGHDAQRPYIVFDVVVSPPPPPPKPAPKPAPPPKQAK
jgi:hypothetical protein